MQTQWNGDMRAIFFDETDISSTYSTPSKDGRLIINGWKDLFDVYDVGAQDKIIIVLYHGNAGTVLFLHTIVKGVGE